MPLSQDAFNQFVETREVLIETRSDERAYRTIIWVVEGGGDLYIRSYRGDAGVWYQRALADPRVVLIAGDVRAEFDSVLVDDPESIELASGGFREKYPKSRSLDAMLRPEVLHTTMRLDS